MGAAHVVGNDFQLRLGIDTGLAGEQQVATELGCVRALGDARNIDRTVEDGVGLPGCQTFLQLIQLTLRPVEAHSGVGRQLLFCTGHGKTFQCGFGMAFQLDHPRLHPTQRPSGHNRREGIPTARSLLHRQMRQERSLTISRSQKTMA